MGGLCQITHLRYPVKPPLLFVHPDDTFDPHSTATATWFRWFFSPLLWASDLSQSRALFCFHLDRIVAASCVWTSSMHKVLLLLWACHLRRSLWLRPRERQAYQAHPLHHQCHWLPQPAHSPNMGTSPTVTSSLPAFPCKSISHSWPPLPPFRREKLLYSPGEQLTSFMGSLAMSLPKSSKTPAIGTAIDVWSTGMIASIRIHKRNTSSLLSLHRHRHLLSPLQPLFSCRQYHFPRSA